MAEGEREDDESGYPSEAPPKKTFSGESTIGPDGDGATTTGNTVWYDEKGTPIGAWRTKLCTCCDVLTQSTFWMGFCCTPILMAQLITRLNLTWNGRADAPKEETSLSYNRIVLSYLFIALTLWKIPVVGGLSLLVFYLLVVVYIGCQVRLHMRNKYNIPTSKYCCPQKSWGQRLNDFVTMLLCGCCASIQMARHTHDDKEYPGHGCTTTGLGFEAPDLV
jgi:Cys-rich protein (TIGR01571 family)